MTPPWMTAPCLVPYLEVFQMKSSTKTSRPRSTRLSLIILLLGALGFSTVACQDPTGIIPPEAVQAFNSLTGSNLTQSEATEKCVAIDTQAGPGSCKAIVFNLVANRKPGAPDKPYQYFATCDAAVRYLFEGRRDLSRALKVTKRESTNRPNAKNGTHLGCGQLSQNLRNGLKGPWDDAYYNVLRIRETTGGDLGGGWCHWDLVNYCKAGGEFP